MLSFHLLKVCHLAIGCIAQPVMLTCLICQSLQVVFFVKSDFSPCPVYMQPRKFVLSLLLKTWCPTVSTLARNLKNVYILLVIFFIFLVEAPIYTTDNIYRQQTTTSLILLPVQFQFSLQSHFLNLYIILE